jgi:hypothetical protein
MEKQYTLEQAKKYRLLLRIAFAIVAFIIPIIITVTKFDILTKANTTKVSILGILILVLIAWRFKNKIGTWIDSWENSNIFKHILIGISKIWVFLLILIILYMVNSNTTKTLSNLIFCIEWISVCEAFSYMAIYPLEMKFSYIIERNIRKQERKEDYKEAIKEMSKEE